MRPALHPAGRPGRGCGPVHPARHLRRREPLSSRAGAFVRLLAVAALAAANPALAADQDDCRTLALLADSRADWSQLSIDYRDGLLDLGVPGSGDLLTGFTGCQLDGGQLAEVDCSWKNLSRADALARFARVKTALARCIAADFTLAENTSAIDGLTVRQDYSATITSNESDDTVDASLKLLEFADDDYWVDLDFQR